MAMHMEHENQRSPHSLRSALVWLSVAAAGGIALVVCARHFGSTRSDDDQTGADPRDDQAVTVRVPLEQAETAWVSWCESGHAKLKNDYSIRFEPAPGARGTEVHLSGGGSKGRTREELRRFKQFLETGEITASDGPDLGRAAQPAKQAARPATGIAESL